MRVDEDIDSTTTADSDQWQLGAQIVGGVALLRYVFVIFIIVILRERERERLTDGGGRKIMERVKIFGNIIIFFFAQVHCSAHARQQQVLTIQQQRCGLSIVTSMQQENR